MEDVILGCFYLKITNSGNLTGEFTNQGIGFVASESVNFISGSESSYIGIYTSAWSEKGNAMSADLRISLVENTRKYALLWELPNGDLFEGEGFLVDGMMVGAYRNVKK